MAVANCTLCYDPRIKATRKKMKQEGGRPYRRRVSEYGRQLRAKQDAKQTYGMRERQFSNLFTKARAQMGDSAQNLQKLLERRLDNVVFRMGFAPTRPQARQLVSHAHFTVNGRKLNIPSYQVKPGDVIALREKSVESQPFKDVQTHFDHYNPPSWLSIDKASREGKMLSVPAANDLPSDIDGQAIVEFYSR